MYLSAVPGGGIDLLRPAQETAAVKEEEKEVWITNQTARRSPGGPAFQIGMVVGNESQGIAVRAKSEYRSMRLAGPWGVYSLPPEAAIPPWN